MAILKKLARNHPEDTVSDVLQVIFKEHVDVTAGFLKNFIPDINKYTIIDVARNFIVNGRYRPDLTIILRRGVRGQLNFFHIETKITARENKYGQGIRSQCNQYSRHMEKANIKSLRNNCVLLCPSYYFLDEDYLSRFDFRKLLNLLQDGHSNGLAKELIKFIEEEYEGLSWKLQENCQILEHPIKFKYFQKMVKDIKDLMAQIHADNDKVSKSGLWTKTSFAHYFQISVKIKGTWEKKKVKGYLTYEFYNKYDCKTPLKFYFPAQILDKFNITLFHHSYRETYCCDLLDDISGIEALGALGFKDSDLYIKKLIELANTANSGGNRGYIEFGNRFLSSSLIFIEAFDAKVAEKYGYYTEFRHQCSKQNLKMRLRIKRQAKNNKHIDLVFDPLNPDIDQIFMWESNVQFIGFKNHENTDTYCRKLAKKQYDPEAAAEYVFSEISKGV